MSNRKGENPTPPRRSRRRWWLVFLPAFSLLLVGAEIGLERTLAAYVARPDFRFLSHCLAGWPELRSHLTRSAEPKIFFLGDSIVQGISVGRGMETIPYGFHLAINEGRERPIRVVNAGLAGSSLAVNRLLLEQLLDTHPTAVFLVVNYRALNRGGISPAYATLSGGDGQPMVSLPDSSPYSFAALLRRRVSLLRNHCWLFGWWFGAPPEQAIQRFFYIMSLEGWREAALRELHLGEPRRWHDTPWSAASRAALSDSFAIPPLQPDDPQLRDIIELGRLATAHGIDLTVVIPPLNTHMVESLALLDLPTYRHNVQMVELASRRARVGFLDASNWIDHSLFADSVHLTPAGNLTFGRQLAEYYLQQPETVVE